MENIMIKKEPTDLNMMDSSEIKEEQCVETINYVQIEQSYITKEEPFIKCEINDYNAVDPLCESLPVSKFEQVDRQSKF